MRTLVQDRRELHRKAKSWQRRGKSGDSFEEFVRRVWPTGVERVGDKYLQHLISYVFIPTRRGASKRS